MPERADVIRLMEVVRDDLAGGWTNTDRQIETWLRGTVNRRNDVPWRSVMLWCGRYNSIVRLEEAKAATGNSAAIRSAAAILLATIESGQDLELSSQEVRSFMSNLVPAVFTSDEGQALTALGTETVARFQFYGVPVSPGAIARARAIS